MAKGSAGGNDAVAGVDAEFYLDRGGSVAPQKQGRDPFGSGFIGSPYDVDARLSRKRSTYWVGYKVHLTEMCDEDLPLVITNVETSPATTQDFDLVRTSMMR